METNKPTVNRFISRTTTPTPLARRFFSRPAILASSAGLLCALAALTPTRSFGLGITTGSQVDLGSFDNDIVQVTDPGGSGTGTILKITPYNGGEDIDVLTADHVVRNGANSGMSLFGTNQVTVTLPGYNSFKAVDEATDFTIPTGGNSAVDLAMLDIFVPGNMTNTLPNGLSAALLPGAQPGANTSLALAGYGLGTTVTNLGGSLTYSYSTKFNWGSAYGTLRIGPNSVNGSGITTIQGAISSFSNNTGFVQYSYKGFQNGAVINGTSPNYNGSTAYLFPGDSGGPALLASGSTNTIIGVNASGAFGNIPSDTNALIAVSGNTNYTWQDVSVYDNLTWINMELATLSIPEPTSAALLTVGGAVALMCQRRMKISAGIAVPPGLAADKAYSGKYATDAAWQYSLPGQRQGGWFSARLAFFSA